MDPTVAAQKTNAFQKTLVQDSINGYMTQGKFREARKVALQYGESLGLDLEKVTNAIEDRENTEYNRRYTRKQRTRAEEEYQRVQQENRIMADLNNKLLQATSPLDVRLTQHGAEAMRQLGVISPSAYKKINKEIGDKFKDYSNQSDLQLSRMMFEATPNEMRKEIGNRIKQFRLTRKDAAIWYRRADAMKPGKNPRELQEVRKWIDSRFKDTYFKRKYTGHLAERAKADAMLKFMELTNSGNFRDLKLAATVAVYGYNPGSKAINMPNVEGLDFTEQSSPEALTQAKMKHVTKVQLEYDTMSNKEKAEAQEMLKAINEKLEAFRQQKKIREMEPSALAIFNEGYEAVEATFEELNLPENDPIEIPFDNGGLFP